MGEVRQKRGEERRGGKKGEENDTDCFLDVPSHSINTNDCLSTATWHTKTDPYLSLSPVHDPQNYKDNCKF